MDGKITVYVVRDVGWFGAGQIVLVTRDEIEALRTAQGPLGDGVIRRTCTSYEV